MWQCAGKHATAALQRTAGGYGEAAAAVAWVALFPRPLQMGNLYRLIMFEITEQAEDSAGTIPVPDRSS